LEDSPDPGSAAKADAGENGPEDPQRRTLLKYGVVASAIVAVGGLGALVRFTSNPAPSGPSTRTFPRLRVGNVNNLVVGQSLIFAYPLDNEPNILVKLGVPAQGGVGPDGDIVAFSQICQHLGCNYGFLSRGASPPCNPSYQATKPVGYCCCHGTIYDFTTNATVVSGPSPRPQPQVTLAVDGVGDIYAVGMGPPAIFGHGTGSNDVSNDLVGGDLVG
jgi:arsenite oxidase small subunit